MEDVFQGIRKHVEDQGEDVKRLNALRQAMLGKSKPQPPRLRQSHPAFERIGQAVQMDPIEVQLLIEAAFTSSTEAIEKAFNNILILGRLRAGDAISRYREERDIAVSRYEENLAAWALAEAGRVPAKIQYDQLESTYGDAVKVRWNEILNEAQVEFEKANYLLAQMDPKMKTLAMVLAQSSRFFNLNGDKTLIACSWGDGHKFHTDHILQIFRKLTIEFEKLVD